MGDGRDLRPGEVRREGLAPPDDARLRFIGRIETPFQTRETCPRQGDMDGGPDCVLVVDPPWEEALTGLDRFETLEVLYWLHLSQRSHVLQSPRSDGRVVGTFALRSPVRPNPIGVSRVRLIALDGPRVTVRGLDCLNNTPLLDIKPDRCAFSVQAAPKPARAADDVS